MVRLAKHFEHRLAVRRDEHSATIPFPDGLCTLDADDQTLNIRIESASPESLSRIQEVVARHLKQVASQESFEVTWSREAESAQG
jgi:uncharacterized protein